LKQKPAAAAASSTLALMSIYRSNGLEGKPPPLQPMETQIISFCQHATAN